MYQYTYPYHVQKIQCLWILTQGNGESNFLNNVIYTDKAGFTREGVFNVHNNREALGQIPATI
jgi:hypothetical protein